MLRWIAESPTLFGNYAREGMALRDRTTATDTTGRSAQESAGMESGEVLVKDIGALERGRSRTGVPAAGLNQGGNPAAEMDHGLTREARCMAHRKCSQHEQFPK